MPLLYQYNYPSSSPAPLPRPIASISGWTYRVRRVGKVVQYDPLVDAVTTALKLPESQSLQKPHERMVLVLLVEADASDLETVTRCAGKTAGK